MLSFEPQLKLAVLFGLWLPIASTLRTTWHEEVLNFGECNTSSNGRVDIQLKVDTNIITQYYKAGLHYIFLKEVYMFPAVFNVTNLNGQNGFIINGINGMSGSAVSYAGDVNDDGVSDLIIGAPLGGNNGQCYTIFGSKTFNTTFYANNLNGLNGLIINGVTRNGPPSYTGISVSYAGDVNNDSIADVIIGAYGANQFAGQSYVIFGREYFSSPFNVTNLNGQNGFAINGINAGDDSGLSVDTAGDVNNDGITDVIIGAPSANNGLGGSYVIYGGQTFSSPFNLSSINGQNGLVINGMNTGGAAFMSVSHAGDINNDGVEDIIIGIPFANNIAGQAYVIFGNEFLTSPFNAQSLNGKNGFIINGTTNIDFRFGMSASYAGDINNDGIDDIIISSLDNNYAGKSYAIYGSKTFEAYFNLQNLNGSNGFIIYDINTSNDRDDQIIVNYAGDVNNDGIDDVIIGSQNTNNNCLGQAYVIFGNKNFSSSFYIESLNGQNGFTMSGVNNYDYLGSSVSYAGDVNNDGIDDVIIGATGPGRQIGQSYVIFGQNSTNDDFCD